MTDDWGDWGSPQKESRGASSAGSDGDVEALLDTLADETKDHIAQRLQTMISGENQPIEDGKGSKEFLMESIKQFGFNNLVLEMMASGIERILD